MRPDILDKWLEKAREDEQVVAAIKAANGPSGMAAYHVQQAAEKYLKAALVAARIPPPKTHDLPQLLGLVPNANPPVAVEDAAAMTSAFAWLTRYPGSPEIDQKDLADAEANLNVIRVWCVGYIDHIYR